MPRPERVYRVAKWLMVYVCLSMVLAVTVPVITVATQVDTVVMRIVMLFLLLCAGGWAVVWLFRSATVVYPDRIVVRRFLRSRPFLWTDIVEIRPYANPEAWLDRRIARELVAVRDRQGRWTQLPHVNNRDLHSWQRSLSTELYFLSQRWSRAVGLPSDFRP